LSLSVDDIVRLARLARFTLSPEEVERFRAQLNSVLKEMSILATLDDVPDAGDGESTVGVRLREDDNTPDKLQLPLDRLSPDLVGGFFTVPRVLGNGGRAAP
jgi:aspartyl/glutamyl-tRNA(Asn/Gln) amidotransferase C subunit